jgi:aspartyl-tRNA(Asn)/glutamyl-tRNA(Gln) amidotransferase subunit A
MSRTDDALAYLSIGELHAAYARGDTSPVEVVEAYLARIDAYDGALRSHATVCRDAVRLAAKRAEIEIRRQGPRGPLHGIPLSHKDNLWTRGVRTGCHSRTSFDHVPDQDATAVARLHEAGALLLGKTNTTEFACGDQDVVGDTPNPWDVRAHSGASSAGSASALAAGLTAGATGSDTGGSIRAPAALCGVVGVKPTYGRVSRHGLVPLAWSMDHVGPMARTVADAATMLQAMAGGDSRDPTSDARPVPDYAAALTERLPGMRVGVPIGYFFDGLEPDVEAAVRAALTVLEDLGVRLVPVHLPTAGDLAAAGSLLSMWEAFALHAATLRREGATYGRKARAQIGAGGFHSAADVAHALQVRALWGREVARAFDDVDVLVTPTLPFTRVGRDAWIEGPPDTSWATRAFSLTGHPALTLPCGFDRAGSPIALQVAARRFDEATMFRVGHAYEQATPWHARRPDPAPWTRAVPSSTARARVAPVTEGTLAGLRAEAERLELPFDDRDLARIHGLVHRVRQGLAPLRPAVTVGLEPDLRYTPPDLRGAP